MTTATKCRKRRPYGYGYPLPFTECAAEVQEKAVEKFRDEAFFQESNWEQVHEQLENDLHDYYGLSDCTLYVSLNCCQGDGVAFEGTPDLDEWAEAMSEVNEQDRDGTLKELLAELDTWGAFLGVNCMEEYCKIKHHGHYYHWNSMDVSVTVDYDDYGTCFDQDVVHAVLDPIIIRIEKWCQEKVKDISRALERDGYENIDYYSSDECIREYLEGSNHEFDEEGNVI